MSFNLRNIMNTVDSSFGNVNYYIISAFSNPTTKKSVNCICLQCFSLCFSVLFVYREKEEGKDLVVWSCSVLKLMIQFHLGLK